MKIKIPEIVPVYNLQNTVAAMIELAIEDYRKFVKRGQIVAGIVIRERFSGAKKNINAQNALNVLHFFKAGILDEWISISGLEIAPEIIRQKLGLPKKVAV